MFGLKLGQDLVNRTAHPYREFRGVPPPPPLGKLSQKYTFDWGKLSKDIKQNININTLNVYNVQNSHFSVPKSTRRQTIIRRSFIQCADNSMRVVRNITSFIMHMKISGRVILKIQNSSITALFLMSRTMKIRKLKLFYCQKNARYRAKELWRDIFLGNLSLNEGKNSVGLPIFGDVTWKTRMACFMSLHKR